MTDELDLDAIKQAVQSNRCPYCDGALHEPSAQCAGISIETLQVAAEAIERQNEAIEQANKRLDQRLDQRLASGRTFDIDELAAETGMTAQELHDARYAASRWPKDKRHWSVQWEVYKILAPHPNRFKVVRDGMTVAEAQQIMRDYSSAS